MFVENKEQFKQYIKIAITRILGILIPVVILFIYLLVTEAIQEFMNYAVFGIGTFSNRISYLGLLKNNKIEIRVLSILMPISIMLMAIILIIAKVLKKKNVKILNLLTILMYSFSIIIVMYPISDEIHFLIGSLIAIIGLIYMIVLFGKYVYNKIKFARKYKLYKIISFYIWILIFSVILIESINNVYRYIKIEKNTEIKHYKNIEIREGIRDRIDNIDEYILKKELQGNKVYILDVEAVIYMVPLDKYNKDYDMFLIGNIGKYGQEGQIEKIKKKDENTLYLIRNENIETNWQTPLDVIKYIRNNLEKIGEVSMYEVYR